MAKAAKAKSRAYLQCNREGLLSALNAVWTIIPARSPKPILQNVLLTADPEAGSTFSATDLEIGIRRRILGIKADEKVSVVLPSVKLRQILQHTRDEELAFDIFESEITIRGDHCEYTLPLEDADLFPAVPDFTAASYHVLASADLKRAIHRTLFAIDLESTRYALGGVSFEYENGQVITVATDGRRLVKVSSATEPQGAPVWPTGTLVVPAKALKLTERTLDGDDPPVHLAWGFHGKDGGAANSFLLRSDLSVIYSRLVEGRFPRYQDVFPSSVEHRITVSAGQLLSAIEQASILTAEESRGVSFEFSDGMLTLKSQAADVGKSRIQLPIDFTGEVKASFDPRYAMDPLKAVDPTDEVQIEMVDHKTAAVMRFPGSYFGVLMPLTVD